MTRHPAPPRALPQPLDPPLSLRENAREGNKLIDATWTASGMEFSQEDFMKEVERAKGPADQAAQFQAFLAKQAMGEAEFENLIHLRARLKKMLSQKYAVSDAETGHFLGLKMPIGPEGAEQFAQQVLSGQGTSVWSFTVCLLEDNRAIGNVTLRNPDRENGSAEVAIVITEKASVAPTSTGRRPILSASMLSDSAPSSTPKLAAANTGPCCERSMPQSCTMAGPT